MILIAEPSHLSGAVRIPASKSHTIRALLMAGMAAGESRILNPLDSADTRSCVAACRALGAEVETGERWTVRGVEGKPRPPSGVIDVGNSGTTLFLALGCAALADDWIEFDGDAQTRRRSAGPLLASLRDLGAEAVSRDDTGCAPIRVKGPLRGGRTAIQCPTSQYLSSLLLCCPLASHDTFIEVPELNERPYVEMTLQWLNTLNIRYSHENMERFEIPGGQSFEPFTESIRGDFSSATFFLCAAAITQSDLTLEGLDMNDVQGDKAVARYLREMGAEVHARPGAVRIRGKPIHGAVFDLNATPDALPAMAVTASFASGTTRFVNVPQARIKETDRIRVMCQAIRDLGGDAEELPDGLVVRGGGLRGGSARGHGDHRVVMALAIAGLASEEPVTVDTAESVGITFPTFVDLMRQAGARMRTQD
jgi:3-phosphoshikimate 1-carboxyvinyltransferase